MGQLKRKGKWDVNGEFYKNKNKPQKASSNAISNPHGKADPTSLLAKGGPLTDINSNLSTSGPGRYIPTEFPLEAKMMA
jgi:hypothetical protein